jgi:aminoglycoside phosphotransferase (APT) family kinase protein
VTAMTQLARDDDRVDLARLGLEGEFTQLLLTPRFRTSRHVVALLFRRGASDPELVVKLARLGGDAAGIAREASVLTTLADDCPKLRETFPRVLAWAGGDDPFLLETALRGQLLSPRRLRADSVGYISAVVDWLMALSATRHESGDASYERLLGEPLGTLADAFPAGGPEQELVGRTVELVEPLRDADMPRVIEHGDLAHPNLIWLEGTGIRVVDWELAEPDGLPLHDLLFFLAYATFALRRPRTDEERIASFHDSFFAAEGWARASVSAYLDNLGVDSEALVPLFVGCWARYMTHLALRIAAKPSQRLSDDAVAWIRKNRHYALWAHTVTHIDELRS